MEEFLRLLATGDVQLEPLVELELPVDRAAEAYAALTGDRAAAGRRAHLRASARREPVAVLAIGARRRRAAADGEVRVALVGAGSFVRAVHLPNLRRAEGARVTTVVSRGGAVGRRPSRARSACARRRRLAGSRSTTRTSISSSSRTRHDIHAEIAAAALRAGKAVFVEKPLGLTREEIDDVWAAGARERPARDRLQPPLRRARRPARARKCAPRPARSSSSTASPPPLPPEHWLNDPLQGGGRILGEACHMFDFANWLCGTPERVFAVAPAGAARGRVDRRARRSTIQYADGSVATVHYSGVGSTSMPKERIEVMRGGRSWVLDDFSSLTTYGPDGERTEKAQRRQGPRRAARPRTRGGARRRPVRAGSRRRVSRAERRARRARVDRLRGAGGRRARRRPGAPDVRHLRDPRHARRLRRRTRSSSPRCATPIVHRGPDDGGSWDSPEHASRSGTAGSRSSTSPRPATSR